MKERKTALLLIAIASYMPTSLGCRGPKGDLAPFTDNAGDTSLSGSGGEEKNPYEGSGAIAGHALSGGTEASGGRTAGSGESESGGGGGVVAGSGATGGAGAGATGGAGGETRELPPTIRNPKYSSMAPPMGEPLPDAPAGEWTWIEIEGAISRDGSPAGFYYKFSSTGDQNLMIYLVGGGACQDVFFCNNNPPNKEFSLTSESVIGGILNLIGPDAEPQDPTLPRWQTGIFKDDPANPVKDWNMVFIPYVTGDVFAGNRRDAVVSGYPAPGAEIEMQFVGKPNMLKFLGRIVPTFPRAPIVLLTGSSAGGLGALMNTSEVADSWVDLNTGTRIFVVDDAGPIFTDAYTEVCLQQRYRELFNLSETLPSDCAGCFNADGGGLAAGYLAYIIDKYPDNLLGGLIDSSTDEIMELFYSDGLNDCSPDNYPVLAYLTYPIGRYTEGLTDLVNNHMSRMSSYIWNGTLHQNLFATVSGDRFYQTNGLSMTIAQWLTKLLAGEQANLGLE
ncbi:MAG: hypothetical protein JXA30_13360 [Deltaproteobacteria bacterium]|nr:hypothetical protein [Deltaproteobacteria bacterium]